MRKLILPLAIGLCFGSTAAIAGEDMAEVDIEADIDESSAVVVFDDLDADDDNVLTVAEVEAYSELDAQFDALDADDNDELTEEEFLVVTDWDADLEPEQRDLLVFVNDRARGLDETILAAEDTGDLAPDATDDLNPDEEPDKFDPDWADTNEDTATAAVDVDVSTEADPLEIDEPEAEIDVEADTERDTIASVDMDESDVDVEAEADMEADADVTASVDTDVPAEAGIGEEPIDDDESLLTSGDTTGDLAPDDTDDLAHDQNVDKFDPDWADTRDRDAVASADIDVETDADVMSTDEELGIAAAGGTKMDAEVDIEKVRVYEGELEMVYDPNTTESVKSEGLYAIFEAIDTDDNQYIDREEAEALEGLSPMFVELDTDANGELEIQEFDALVKDAY